MRALVYRVFRKLLASLLNGWLFAGSAVAQELQFELELPAIAANNGPQLKIAAVLILIGAILALARPARPAA